MRNHFVFTPCYKRALLIKIYFLRKRLKICIYLSFTLYGGSGVSLILTSILKLDDVFVNVTLISFPKLSVKHASLTHPT